MQLSTASRIISAGLVEGVLEQAGLLGRAIRQVRAARQWERQNRKAGRVAHPHRRTPRERRGEKK